MLSKGCIKNKIKRNMINDLSYKLKFTILSIVRKSRIQNTQ